MNKTDFDPTVPVQTIFLHLHRSHREDKM